MEEPILEVDCCHVVSFLEEGSQQSQVFVFEAWWEDCYVEELHVDDELAAAILLQHHSYGWNMRCLQATEGVNGP